MCPFSDTYTFASMYGYVFKALMQTSLQVYHFRLEEWEVEGSEEPPRSFDIATLQKTKPAKHEDATLGKVDESVIKAQIILKR